MDNCGPHTCPSKQITEPAVYQKMNKKRNVAYMHDGSVTAFIVSDITEGQCNQRILYEKKPIFN